MPRRVIALLLVAVLGGGLFAIPITAAPGEAPEIETAIAFSDIDGQFAPGHTVVELRFDRAINASSLTPEEVEVDLREGKTAPEAILNGASINDQQLLLDLGAVSKIPVEAVDSVDIDDGTTIKDGNGSEFKGANIEKAEVTRTTATLTEGAENRTLFRGETVAIIGDQAGEAINIRTMQAQKLVTRTTIRDDGQVTTIDTTDMSFGQYAVFFDGSQSYDPATGDRWFELGNFSMELLVNKNPDVDDATVIDTENLTGSISTNAAGERITVSVRNDRETIRSATLLTEGRGTASFDFAPISDFDDEDWYFDLIATHPSSGTTAFRDVKISKVDHDADFAQPDITETRGDIVEIPVRLSPDVSDKVAVDHATVIIGTEDVGYRAVVTVFDGNNDHRVDLRWNTYLAGSNGTDAFSVAETERGEREDGFTVERIATDVEGGSGDVLDAALYDLTVRPGANAVNSTATDIIGTSLDERYPTNISVYTAPAAGYDDTADLRNSITEVDAVADGQYAVVRAKTGGIFGDLSTRNDLVKVLVGSDESERPIDGIELTIEDAEPPPNKELRRVNETSVVEVFTNADNDSIYLLIDTAAADFIEADSEYKAYWQLNERHGLIEGDDKSSDIEREERRTGFDVVSQDATFDTADSEGQIGLQPSKSVTLTGDTTLAPGSELRVRLETVGPGPANLDELVVDANQTFSTHLNLSVFPVGTNVSILVTADGEQISDTVSGQVGTVRASKTTTRRPPTDPVTETTTMPTSETSKTAPTSTIPQSTTETAMTTSEVTPTITTTESPGFGFLTGGFVFLSLCLMCLKR